jgi:Bacterial PH domain
VDFAYDDSIDTNVLPRASDHVDGTPVSTKSQGSFGQLVDWLGNNASQLDPSRVEAQLTTVTPVLLQGEKVHLAFKAGRDTTVFTDKRILMMDVQGLMGKKIEFLTVKWSSISAFAVQTAGQFFDRDTEMKLITNMLSRPILNQDFRKSGADVMLIQKYLTNRILMGGSSLLGPEPVLPHVDRKAGHVDDAKGSWWFRDNQRPLDAVEMEQYYKTQVPILHS